MPPPVGLPLRLSVGGCWLCFFLMLCVLCVVFIGMVIHLKHLRFAVSLVLALALTHDAKHIGQTLTTVHSKHTHITHPHTNIHTPHPTPASAIACVTQLYESRRLVSMSCFKRSPPALHTFCSSHWGFKFPYEHEHVLNKKGHYAMKKKTQSRVKHAKTITRITSYE